MMTQNDLEGSLLNSGDSEAGRKQCFGKRLWVLAVGLGAAGALSGCVQVTAPDKPIVIELNINIRQEVVYRLAADAAKTVEQNASIF